MDVRECPNCHQQAPETAPETKECPSCGVVFLKFKGKRPLPQKTCKRQKKYPGKVGSNRKTSRGVFYCRQSQKLSILYSQLGRMLESGLSMPESLNIMTQNTHGALSIAWDAMRIEIETGKSFSQAAQDQTLLFSSSSISLLEAGEAGGSLPGTLFFLAASLDLNQELSRLIWRACIYPFILFTLVFFVPKAHLLVTRGWAHYLISCFVPYLYTLGALALVFIGLPKVVERVFGRALVCSILGHVPGIGGLLGLASTVRFGRHLAILLDAGLDVVTCLRLAGRSTNSLSWVDKMTQSEKAVMAGGTLRDALAASGLFDEGFLLSVAAGERSGRLVQAIEQYAEMLQTTLVHRLNVSVQLCAVAILLLTYVFVSMSVVSEFERVLKPFENLMPNGSGLEDLLKEFTKSGRPQQLPREIRELLP
jgi:type II secretory pathway component PulF